MGVDASRVTLAAVIGHIRRELQLAQTEGTKSEFAFKTGPVELEFEVEVAASGKTEGAVDVWVVSFGARGELSRSSRHRVKITLQPVNRHDGEAPLISDIGTH